MPNHDPYMEKAYRRLERAGFYRHENWIDPTSPIVQTATEVLAQPLVEASEKPVDSSIFRDQIVQFRKSIDPLREAITRDISRLERTKGSIPHVAPKEIAKRNTWIEQLDAIDKLVGKMLYEG
jgi:hypothetical protein